MSMLASLVDVDEAFCINHCVDWSYLELELV
jgi:hypothetical protein